MSTHSQSLKICSSRWPLNRRPGSRDKIRLLRMLSNSTCSIDNFTTRHNNNVNNSRINRCKCTRCRRSKGRKLTNNWKQVLYKLTWVKTNHTIQMRSCSLRMIKWWGTSLPKANNNSRQNKIQSKFNLTLAKWRRMIGKRASTTNIPIRKCLTSSCINKPRYNSSRDNFRLKFRENRTYWTPIWSNYLFSQPARCNLAINSNSFQYTQTKVTIEANIYIKFG